MTQSPAHHATSTAISLADLHGMGGAPALIPGEKAADYDVLLAGVLATVRPADLLEEVWTREVVELIWDAVRHRRLKAATMTASAGDGMQKLLLSIGARDTFGLAQRWFARDLAAVARVDALLEAAGLGIDHVMAQTIGLRIAEIERLDRLIAIAEARRNAALHEIERHRAGFAAALRRAGRDIECTEFAEATPRIEARQVMAEAT